MNVISLRMFFLSFLLCVCSNVGVRAETAESRSPNASAWTDDEKVLSEALLLRARLLEKDSGIHFDSGWVPLVSIEYGIRDGAQYRASTQTIVLPISFVYRLNAEYHKPIRELDPTLIAKIVDWAPIADHELGHALMDQVSRRHGYGALDLEKLFETVPPDEQLGLNIVMEGVGTYFQYFRSTPNDLSSLFFPSDDERGYTYEMVAMRGGHWLVNDILATYGERGMLWLIAHRLVIHGNIRTAAVEYHKRALRELAE